MSMRMSIFFCFFVIAFLLSCIRTAVPPQPAQGLFRAPARALSLSPTGIVSRPGASAFFVSDGPISSNSGRNGGKNAGRNCVSALPQRAMADSDFLRILAGITFHHRCQSKGLRVRSPARRLTRPLASATAGVFRSYRRTPQAFPLGGRWRAAPDEGSPVPPAGAILFPKNQKGSTPAGCSLSVVLYLFFPLSATIPVRDRSASAPYSAAPGSAVFGELTGGSAGGV